MWMMFSLLLLVLILALSLCFYFSHCSGSFNGLRKDLSKELNALRENSLSTRNGYSPPRQRAESGINHAGRRILMESKEVT